MKNIRIKKIRTDYFVVMADTERFGKQEIVFEGVTFEECAAWIKANVKKQKRALWAVEVRCDATQSVTWVCVRSRDCNTAFKQVWRMGYNEGYHFYKETVIA